jgi:hypothetical protein
MVIKDYKGQCIAASQRFLPHVVNAHMAEAYAFREGLVIAQQIRSNSFTLQTDCMQVVETMKNGGFSATTTAVIYDGYPFECFGNVSLEYFNSLIR